MRLRRYLSKFIILVLVFNCSIGVALSSEHFDTEFSHTETKTEGKIKKKFPSVKMFPSLIPSFPLPTLGIFKLKKDKDKDKEIEAAIKKVEQSASEQPEKDSTEKVVEKKPAKKIRTYSEYKAGLYEANNEQLKSIEEEEVSVDDIQETKQTSYTDQESESISDKYRVEKEDTVQEKESSIDSNVSKEVQAVNKEDEINITDDSNILDVSTIEGSISHQEGKLRKFWRWFKGKPVENNVQLEMVCKHFFTDTEYNETNHLLGMDINGYTFGFLKNSYKQDTFFAGVSRYVWRKNFTDDFNMDLRYMASIMHGYKDKYPNIEGYTPLILPKLGFTYKKIGMDLWMIPSDTPIFCINSRFNLPSFKKKNKKL